MDEIIHIEKYDPKIVNGVIQIYAVQGKKTYPIPSAYADMCDNDHLAIMKRTLAQPELYETTAEHYVPLYTGAKA